MEVDNRMIGQDIILGFDKGPKLAADGHIISVTNNNSSGDEDEMMLEIIESMSDDGTEEILREMLKQRQQQQPCHQGGGSSFDEEKESESIREEEEEGEGNEPRGPQQQQDFSLSNIGWALHTSTAQLGSVTAHLLQEAQTKSVETLRASFSHLQLPPSPNSNGHYNSASIRSLPTKWCDHPSLLLHQQQQQEQQRRRRSCIDFGCFEERALSLQYNQEDVYNIAADPVQFDELQRVLRATGATTNLVLKEKLHWYIVNTKKRARAERAAEAAAAAAATVAEDDADAEDIERHQSIYHDAHHE